MKASIVWLLVSVGGDGMTTMATFPTREDCLLVVNELVRVVKFEDHLSFQRLPKCVMARVVVGG